jgi:hypothetical protein
MMKIASIKTAICVALCFVAISVKAQPNKPAPLKLQSTAVPFMMISPDARSGGMGNLSIAMSPEANDLFGNTAKIPYLKNNRGFLINYTPWLRDLGLSDVYLASAGYYKKLNDYSGINSSLRFFSLGSIEFTDDSGQPLVSQKPSEFSYDFGYNILLTDALSMGVTLRYINSRLVQGPFGTSGNNYKAGNTFAGDISLFYKQNEDLEGFHAGLVLSNLGGKVSYSNDAKNKYFIPANIGLGVAYLNKLDQVNSIEMGIDVNRLMVPASPTSRDADDQYYSQSVVSSWFNSFSNQYGIPFSESLKVSLGAEYNYADQFQLRAGYFIDNNKNLGSMQYITVGSSFQYQQSKFNISYLVPTGGGITRNPLSNTLRFGSIFYF